MSIPTAPVSDDAASRFVRIAEISPQAIYILDLVALRMLYANARLGTLFGRSTDMLMQMPLLINDVVYAPDRSAIAEGHRALREAHDGETVEYEYRVRHPDGALRWIATRAAVFARDAAGVPTQMLAFAQDITQRRLIEEALAEDRVRFERIAETMADAVYLFDVDSNQNIYVNSRFQDIFGYTLEQLRGLGEKLVQTLLHPDDAPVFSQRRVAHRQLRDGEVFEMDFRARRPNGEIRWIHSRETVFSRDAEGFPKQILGTVKDATDARLREDNLKAEARRKDEFLAMLAHELRNPLAPILSAAEVIGQCDVSQFERLQRAREVIERQSRHMAKLVDDLLDVSRSVTGKIALSSEWLSLEGVVARALELSRPLIEAREQEVSVHHADRPLRVFGDATRLAQVLGNLLNNASKYSPRGSRITVTIRFALEQVSIAIADEGAGIAAEFLPHVFDLFSQSARSLDRSEGGLGIGLTLVKSLVEMHGGSVTAESAGVDQGSCFTIRLPAEASEAGSSEIPSLERSQASCGRLRVLVVDDNVDSAEMLALLLETEGYATRCVYDGASALEEVAAGYDAVILDIGLPGMDGFAVAREMRGRADLEGIILIALTGYGQPRDFAQSREAGFDYHLIKPVEPTALCRLLDSIAEGAAQP